MIRAFLRLVAILLLAGLAPGCARQGARPSQAASYLKITRYPGNRGPGVQEPVIAAELKGSTPKTQRFLAGLWSRSRPRFRDSEMNCFGPDSGYVEILFEHEGQRLTVRSWHRGFEENPNLVVTSTGVTSLDGRSRAEVLSADEKWYRDFRQAFDDIVESAEGFVRPKP